MRPKPAWDHLSVWLPTTDWEDARQSMRSIAYPAEPIGSKALTHVTIDPSATLYYIRRAYPPRRRASLLVVNLLARAPACVCGFAFLLLLKLSRTSYLSIIKLNSAWPISQVPPGPAKLSSIMLR